MPTFTQLRQIHPVFIYRSYHIEQLSDSLCFTWTFEVPGCMVFKPSMTFPLNDCVGQADVEDPTLKRLVFCLGMVELVSYWKAFCSPIIRIEAGGLTQIEQDWWRKLYYLGLGEFAYLNGIEWTPDDMFCFELACAAHEVYQPVKTSKRAFDQNRVLIPIGGGKDSVVTLEHLRHQEMDCFVFGINPIQAVKNCISAAEIPHDRQIFLTRRLDPQLLNLNQAGYLNGHTPFSAIVAFSSLITAYLYGIPFIALSNEASANESTVPGTEINHQYSKTTAFERDFDQYVHQMLGLEIRYFSLLRPFSEWAIARSFTQYPQYTSVFRSCNAGSKQNAWCGHCAKCLFIACMLCPFYTIEHVHTILGTPIFEDPKMLPILDQLSGAAPTKAFECVGTTHEVCLALNACLDRYRATVTDLTDLPLLLQQYVKNAQNGAYGTQVVLDAKNWPQTPKLQADLHPLTRWHTNESLPEQFKPIVADLLQPRLETALQERHLAIYGLGMEGQAALRWCLIHAPSLNLKKLTLWDAKNLSQDDVLKMIPKEQPWLSSVLQEQLAAGLIELKLGQSDFGDVSIYDVILKSPGISFQSFDFSPVEGTTKQISKAAPYLSSKVERGWPIVTAQTNWLLQFGLSQSVIGVTGTKGKSTTTRLVFEMLRCAAKNTDQDPRILGNIGVPVMGVWDEITRDTTIALELSSHQLEYMDHAPQVAIITNFYPEHLDHYRSYEAYLNAKLNIVRHQSESDVFVLNLDDAAVVERALPISRSRLFGVTTKAIDPQKGDGWKQQFPDLTRPLEKLFVIRGREIVQYHVSESDHLLEINGIRLNNQKHLPGQHHVMDAALAMAGAIGLGVSVEAAVEGLEAFEGLPHRMAYVGCYQEIDFYNDSIATIPQSTLLAIETLGNVHTLLVGGKDRGISYQAFAEALSQTDIRCVIGLPDTGQDILTRLKAADLKNNCSREYLLASDMDEAVRLAFAHTMPGGTCLLSPAASSYNVYQNFAERGQAFIQAIQNQA